VSDSSVPGKKKIVISSTDLGSAQVEQTVQDMAKAKQVALVRAVGAPVSNSSGTLRAILTLTIGGALGGLAAFLLQRLLFSNLGLFEDNVFATNVGFTFILALCIGVFVSLADVVTNKSWAKVGAVALIAVPAAVVAALVMGVIAHFFYEQGNEWIQRSLEEAVLAGSITDEQEAQAFYITRLHLIRGIAWLLVGVAAGIAAGAAAKSWKRIGLAVLGGAVGGFAGGFLFDFFQSVDDTDASIDRSEILAQSVGITLLGLLVGLATGIVEQAGKSRWIEVASGGLAGKQFILYKSDITLGSSPQADITLIKDPAIPEIAARMFTGGGSARVELVSGALFVNGSAVTQSALRDSDTVTIGGTQLRFRERVQKSQVPGRLR
jgi:hypothetical protein